MGYRLLKVITAYPQFCETFLAENPDYKTLSYHALYERLVGTGYALSTTLYAKYMPASGNEAQDVFVSIEPLQKAWARENGVRYGETTWFKDIVCAQVRSFRPDAIYLQDLYVFDQSFRRLLREVSGKRVILLGWRASPTKDFSIFSDLDLVLTSDQRFVEMFRRHSTNAAFIPISFEPALVDLVEPSVDRHLDFTFAGSLHMEEGFHRGRYAMIDQVMKTTPLELWTNLYDDVNVSINDIMYHWGLFTVNRALAKLGLSKEARQGLPFLHRGAVWAEDPTALARRWRKYRDRIHGPIFGLKYYELLANSKIVFNSHIDSATDYAGNIRLYEATGMGACLVTDWKGNLPDLFDPELEVVTYRSAQECTEKVRFLLSHDKEREAIGSAGQRRTLRDHTHEKRVQTVDQLILGLLAS